MKRMLLICALCIAALAAQAQTVDFAGGFLVAGDSDVLDSGFGLFGFAALRTAPAVSFRGTVAMWAGDTDGAVLSGANYTAVGLEGSVVAHAQPVENVRLWCGGGIGVYSIETDDYGWRRSTSSWRNDQVDDQIGYHLLAGGDLVLMGPSALFLEAKYLFMDTDVEVYEGSSGSVAFSGDMSVDTLFVSLGWRTTF